MGRSWRRAYQAAGLAGIVLTGAVTAPGSGVTAAAQLTYRCAAFGLAYTPPPGWWATGTGASGAAGLCTKGAVYTPWFGYGDDNAGHDHVGVQLIAGRAGKLIRPGLSAVAAVRQLIGVSAPHDTIRTMIVAGVPVVVARDAVPVEFSLYAVARTARADVILTGGVRHLHGHYNAAQATALVASITSLRLPT